MAASDPLVHCFWDRLTPRAQAVVAAEARTVFADLERHAWWAPLNCDLASRRWARAFRKAGVPVAMVSGQYWPEYEPGGDAPGLSDHTWLMVDGFLFDPTAGQFSRNPDGSRRVIEARHYHVGS